MAKNNPIMIKATVSKVKSRLFAVKGLRIVFPNVVAVDIGSWAKVRKWGFRNGGHYVI